MSRVGKKLSASIHIQEEAIVRTYTIRTPLDYRDSQVIYDPDSVPKICGVCGEQGHSSKEHDEWIEEEFE